MSLQAPAASRATGPSDLHPPITAKPDLSPPPSGRMRAAALMQALGDEAGPVWSVLTADEAQLIAGEMRHLPPDNPGSAERTLAALLADGRGSLPAGTGAGTVAQSGAVSPGRQGTAASGPVWHRLGEVPARRLAQFLAGESAQAAAIILSRLPAAHAAATVRAMPEETALPILHRMVALSPPGPAVLAAIETGLRTFLAAGHGAEDGARMVAELFEAMGPAGAPDLLDAFAASGPERAEAVRRLMVPFEAIADFGPAGLQTLLSEVNHDTLALALKGADARTRTAVFANMTQRAGAVLREDMDALGAVPRRDVDAARAQVVALARELIRRGDIRPAQAREDEDLVE